MSGAQTSTFADPNILYKTLSGAGYQEVEQNRLLNQQRTQDIGEKDMAMMGQAGASLLNLNEDQAAAAYPQVRDSLQAQGFGKNLPAAYPGHAVVQAFVQRAMPILQQIQTGFLTTPGSADATKRLNEIYTGAGSPPAQGGQPPQGGPPGLATAESGGKSDVINPQGYTGTYQFGKQRLADLGYYTPAPGENMGDNTTWAGKVSVPGFNVTDQKSFAANPAAQQVVYQTHMANIDKAIDQMPNAGNFDRNGLRAVAHLGGIAGMERFASSGGLYDPADANGTKLSSYYKRFSGGVPGASTTAAAATTPAAQPVIVGDSLASPAGLGGNGVVGDSSAKVLARVQAESRAGKYDGKPVVLSTGASNDFGSDLGSVEQQLREAQAGNAGKITVLGVGPSVEAKAPGTNAKLAALSKAYGADFVPLPADQMSPDGIHPTAQGYATLKTAIAPAQGGPGGGGQPGRYQVASNAPVPPPASTAPAGSDLVGPRVLPPIGTGSPVVTPQSLANTPAPQQQAQIPQPPANRTMPGSPDGPPAPTPVQQPPAQQPPPSARTNLPRAADVPQGLNSPQLQQAQRFEQAAAQLEIEAARNPFDKRMQADAAAKAADLRQRAQTLKQTDTVVQTQDGQLHVATGVIDKPVPHFVWDEKQGAYVDTTGSTAPVTPPSPRLLNVEGVGVVQSKPGGGASLVVPQNTEGITAAEAAKSLGKATGTDVAKQVPQYMQMGQRADQAINVIDSGIQHLSEAQRGNIPTGYFAPWLATSAAALKSAGVDLSAIGIDPKAVGDIQTAQKTLGIVAGSILQNTLGKDSQITDAKIEHFIHTQPGIEMDPQALQRILGWARTQFVFEHNMSIDAMKEAALSPTGTLPLNWAPKYFSDKGAFGPIYNPITSESTLPTGQGPPQQTPPSTPPATTQNAPVFTEGQTATRQDGHKIIFRNGAWVPK